MTSAKRTRSSSRTWVRRRSGSITGERPSRRWRGRRGWRAGLRHALLVERDEIDRIEQERPETAVAYRGRDHLARERKQEPWAFDEQDRLQMLRRHILESEYARKREVEGKHHGSGIFRLAFDSQRHLVFNLTKLLQSEVDGDVDRRLVLTRCQRLRRIGILEREILDVLAQHIELGESLLGLRLRFRRAAIGRGHLRYLRAGRVSAPCRRRG